MYGTEPQRRHTPPPLRRGADVPYGGGCDLRRRMTPQRFRPSDVTSPPEHAGWHHHATTASPTWQEIRPESIRSDHAGRVSPSASGDLVRAVQERDRRDADRRRRSRSTGALGRVRAPSQVQSPLSPSEAEREAARLELEAQRYLSRATRERAKNLGAEGEKLRRERAHARDVLREHEAEKEALRHERKKLALAKERLKAADASRVASDETVAEERAEIRAAARRAGEAAQQAMQESAELREAVVALEAARLRATTLWEEAKSEAAEEAERANCTTDQLHAATACLRELREELEAERARADAAARDAGNDGQLAHALQVRLEEMRAQLETLRNRLAASEEATAAALGRAAGSEAQLQEALHDGIAVADREERAREQSRILRAAAEESRVAAESAMRRLQAAEQAAQRGEDAAAELLRTRAELAALREEEEALRERLARAEQSTIQSSGRASHSSALEAEVHRLRERVHASEERQLALTRDRDSAETRASAAEHDSRHLRSELSGVLEELLLARNRLNTAESARGEVSQRLDAVQSEFERLDSEAEKARIREATLRKELSEERAMAVTNREHAAGSTSALAGAQEELDTLRLRLSELQKSHERQRQEWDDERSGLARNASQYRAKAETLESEKALVAEALKRAELNHQVCVEERDTSNAQLRNARDEIAALRAEVDDMKRQRDNWLNDRRGLEEANAERVGLTAQGRQAQERIRQLTEDVDNLNARFAKEQTQRIEAQTAADETAIRLRSVEDQLKDALSGGSDAHARCIELRTRVADLEQDTLNKDREISRLQQLLQAAEDEGSRSRESCDELRRTLAALEGDLAAERAESARLRDRIGDLEESCGSERANSEGMKKSFGEEKEARERLRAENERLREDLNKVADCLQKSEADRADCKNRITELESEAVVLRTHVADLTDNITELTEELNAARADAAEAQRDASTAGARSKDHDDKLKDLKLRLREVEGERDEVVRQLQEMTMKLKGNLNLNLEEIARMLQMRATMLGYLKLVYHTAQTLHKQKFQEERIAGWCRNMRDTMSTVIFTCLLDRERLHLGFPVDAAASPRAARGAVAKLPEETLSRTPSEKRMLRQQEPVVAGSPRTTPGSPGSKAHARRVVNLCTGSPRRRGDSRVSSPRSPATHSKRSSGGF
eukprot:Hpha_TRINITY_DN16949_c3_g1::TRINITY_DN16949_c3_g1_i1::g.55350::m.55350